MRKMLLAAIAMLPIATAVAHATDLRAMQALREDFRNGASALIYFTAEADGYHVVATVQSDDSEATVIFRFVTVLAVGQTAEISVPHGPGEAPEAFLISRVDDKLVVGEPVTLVSARR
jgi:hypothetical protein